MPDSQAGWLTCPPQVVLVARVHALFVMQKLSCELGGLEGQMPLQEIL